MSGVNKAIILGFLGADPEITYPPSGNPVVNFSVATSEKWKDKGTGEKKERTEWHKIVAFGRLAEICGEYLHKGSQVYLEGKIQTDRWTDREQIERYTTKIIIHNMTMVGGRRGEEGSQGGSNKAEGNSNAGDQGEKDSKDDGSFY